jgi:hypothetical protein
MLGDDSLGVRRDGAKLQLLAVMPWFCRVVLRTAMFAKQKDAEGPKD